MTLSRVSILIMVLTLSYAGASVSALAQAPDATRENLQQRVEQLESQMEAMRVELTKLRNELPQSSFMTTELVRKGLLNSARSPAFFPGTGKRRAESGL